MVLRQKLECARVWEFGCSPKTTVFFIEIALHGHKSFLENLQVYVLCRFNTLEFLKVPCKIICILENVAATVVPGVGKTLQDPWKTRATITVFGWKICTAVKGFTIVGHEYGHGPAALSSHDLHGIHVHAVNIWAFLAVYFNADKILVHQCGNARVFKAFALHHMTPVTGAVTNRK